MRLRRPSAVRVPAAALFLVAAGLAAQAPAPGPRDLPGPGSSPTHPGRVRFYELVCGFSISKLANLEEFIQTVSGSTLEYKEQSPHAMP